MEEVIRRLAASTGEKRAQFRGDFAAFAARHDLRDWEGWFHPYEDETYGLVLLHIQEHDTVLDIGAGDLRLALQVALRAKRVYAVEVNPLLVGMALEEIGLDLPRNLHVICANASLPAFRGVLRQAAGSGLPAVDHQRSLEEQRGGYRLDRSARAP
jgi:tRNA G46 methylase TrmB